METQEKILELRMYFFVIYQLSGIQAGIQSGHAALEYAKQFGNTDLYQDFIQNWKTWIVLNGGTTNDELDIEMKPLGTINQYGDLLNENEIPFSYFREPDLNNSLSSICFIVDERVFNRNDYPDFRDYFVDWYVINGVNNFEILEELAFEKENFTDDDLIKHRSDAYKAWVRMIGGMKNVVLRNLIKDKKLA